jgi:hypothetical protein
MFARLKQRWAELRSDPPGQRFCLYNERHREATAPVKRALIVGSAVVLIPIGIVMMPAPGPGMLVVAIGATMLAGESQPTARLLDRLELAVRALWLRLRGRSRAKPGSL